ncbi:MAG TPA: tyrosine-type recombinase/integrase [Methylomusa anaerophila]|uniref:Tyrosine recombinase XerC n=1 Tax=Methylomusa anaerophila TaxID=1930071 RepID=A0A348AIW6_9FIRM|nr:tyrosine-type recombinase/integrase [Methylomusa anaerophila]BBB91014.1 tyrosine recombinase XerC [Methylomusa anaerophila]HML88885.1 tyrosine-type recombinase/integrase [Methylomusa anaerophila]
MANITPRGKNSYRITISGGTDLSGKRIMYRRTIKIPGDPESEKHKRELEKQVALFTAEVEKGTVTDTENIKLKDFINNVWKPLHVERKKLAPKTVWRYDQLLERILFSLGNLRLKNIKPKSIMEFLKNLEEPGIRKTKTESKKDKPLSQQTILHHYRLLHSILEKAKDWQYIVVNPVSSVESPKIKKSITKGFSEAETTILHRELLKRPVRDQALILLTLSTGSRLGEVLGLTWPRVDLKTGEVNIEKSYQYVPKFDHFEKLPKNESSIRKVTLPKPVIKFLEKLKAEQSAQRLFLGPKWIDKDDAVFTTYLGTRLKPNTLSTAFPKWVEKMGLPHVTFHGLRHTAASLLIKYGASAAEVSKLLGHSTIGTTMNIYVHSFDEASKNMANKMNSILFNKLSKKTQKKQK